MGSSTSSDGLVEEAAGGESAAKSLKESDEKAFCESEVIAWNLKLNFCIKALLQIKTGYISCVRRLFNLEGSSLKEWTSMINLLLLKAGWGQNSISDCIFAIFNIQTALVNPPNKSAYTWSSEPFRYPKNFWHVAADWSIEAVIIHGSTSDLCWRWCSSELY